MLADWVNLWPDRAGKVVNVLSFSLFLTAMPVFARLFSWFSSFFCENLRYFRLLRFSTNPLPPHDQRTPLKPEYSIKMALFMVCYKISHFWIALKARGHTWERIWVVASGLAGAVPRPGLGGYWPSMVAISSGLGRRGYRPEHLWAGGWVCGSCYTNSENYF